MANIPQFQIKFEFSQRSLQSLNNPYVHLDVGCQFNQEDIQRPQVCPVCQIQSNQIEQDSQLIVMLEQKNEKQLVYDKINKTIIQMKRKHYTFDTISTDEEVKQLQIKYYERLRKDQSLTMNKIQEMNQERNQTYFNYLKHLPEREKLPILIGVINNKLLLFYHAYKINVSLSLIDSTNPKIRQKLRSQTHGILQQIVLLEYNIYFLYTKQNISTLYKGDLNQIFQNPSQNMDPQFFILSLPNFKIDGPARLIQIGDKDLIMIGTKICHSITSNIIYQNHKIELLKANAFCHIFNNNQILVVNQEEKDEKKMANYFCYDFSQQKCQQSKVETLNLYNQYDNYLIFADKMILYKTSELQNERCELQQFFSWPANQKGIQPQRNTINVANHQSYMQPVKITSTQKQINNITCQFIGIKLPKKSELEEKKRLEQQKIINQEIEEDETDVFPALLVYNGSTNSFEVELI
ncbi:unnamed protein product [Paramecium sonneborni]|uniref:Uncharacterized protein n=1 Tax=Paramecium sonneborni TaxID=65129 RepID=A0A8S1LHU5_9CILI|nr:unnamed protein product [Paramecium sonneborni]